MLVDYYGIYLNQYRMANKYTDKKLKKILENPPEMKPDFNALSDMMRRLEKAALKKRLP